MNILVIRFSALGDLVTLEPVLRAIRYFNKDANITFLTSSIGKGLYQDTDYFDRYIVHKSFISSVKSIDNHYDIVINLQGNRLSHLLLLFTKIDLIVNKSYTMLQKFLKLKPVEKHFYDIIHDMGVAEVELNKYFSIKYNHEIHLPVVKSNKYKKLFTEKFGNKKVIAIGTGTSVRWESKRWGKERFSKLCEYLREDYGIVLIGTSLEEEDANFIMNNNFNVLNMVNKTKNLTDLKSLISTVDLYIGNDSGPTHIAAAIGNDTLTIFGSTDVKHCPKMIYPNHHICIKPDESITCHPCYKSKCPTNLECMENITVDRVYNEILNYFGEKNAS